MTPDPHATTVCGPLGSFRWFIKPLGDGASPILGMLVAVLLLRRVSASVADGDVGRMLQRTLGTRLYFCFSSGVLLQFVWLYGFFWSVFHGYVRLLYCVCLRLNIRISLKKMDTAR